MTTALSLATATLLEPAALDEGSIRRVLSGLMKPGIDAADLYFQNSVSESWFFEDGIVKDGAHSIEQGVGVRAISGEKTGFAYSDEIDARSLLEAAQSARAISKGTVTPDGLMGQRPLVRSTGRALYAPVDPIDALGKLHVRVRL